MRVVERDWGIEAQRAAEKHLGACMEVLWAEEDGYAPDESPASAPFCGCDTCIVREVLWAAWEIIEQGIKDDLDVRSR